MKDDKRTECDCIYCKDMEKIQEFHDGYRESSYMKSDSYIRE
jgi:hypothetical protein